MTRQVEFFSHFVLTGLMIRRLSGFRFLPIHGTSFFGMQPATIERISSVRIRRKTTLIFFLLKYCYGELSLFTREDRLHHLMWPPPIRRTSLQPLLRARCPRPQAYHRQGPGVSAAYGDIGPSHFHPEGPVYARIDMCRRRDLQCFQLAIES